MSNIYLYFNKLIYNLNDDNEQDIFEDFKKIKPNSKLIYIPEGKVDSILKKEIDLYHFLHEKYSEEELEEINLLNTKFIKDYYVQILPEEISNNIEILKENKIELVSIINYLNTIYNNNSKVIFFREQIDNLFLFKIKSNYYFLFLLNDENQIEYLTFVEDNQLKNIISSLVFAEQKKEKMIILNLSNTFKLDENLKEIEYLFNIENNKNYFDYNLINFVTDKLKTDFAINYSISITDLYKENIFQQRIKEQIINGKLFFNKVKKENTKKIIILGIVVFIFAGINYFINNYLKQNVIDNFNNQISQLESKYRQLQNLYLKEESKRIYSIISKKINKSDKEILVLPYLITYLSHFNLNIKSAELIYDDKHNKYYSFVNVQGFIPDKLFDVFSKNIALKGLDIIPTQNVAEQGFLYVLTFDMGKLYKILYNKKLINIK